jgi:sulfofructose kinase
MADVIICGTVAVDLVLRVRTLPRPGEQVDGRLDGWRMGGSAANLACGLASAGHNVHIVGSVGEDSATDALAGELARRGLRTEHLTRRRGYSSCALILVDDDGERTVIGLPSPQLEPLDPSGISVQVEADLLYVESCASCSAVGGTTTRAKLIATSLPGRTPSVGPAHLVVDSASQLRPEWVADPYANAKATFGDLLRWVVVTKGAAGAMAYGLDEVVTVPAVPAQQVDATGAGDAFAAGLLHGLLLGQPIRVRWLWAPGGGQRLSRRTSRSRRTSSAC